jgi:hypothetical protein
MSSSREWCPVPPWGAGSHRPNTRDGIAASAVSTGASADLARATLYVPPAMRHCFPPVESREQARVSDHRDALRFAERELHALESEQAHALVIRGVRQIDLRNVGARDRARIGHGERRGDRLAAADFQVSVGEGRVAQAVAEGIHRLQILLRIPAVANLRAFVVPNGDRRLPRRAEMRRLDFMDRHGLDSARARAPVDRIAIAQHVSG